MDKKQKWPRLFFKVARRNLGLCCEWSDPQEEHFSAAWIEVPYEVSQSGDPNATMIWLGEELKFQWVPQTGVMCFTQDHVKDLIGEEIYG
tara:strand:- start:75 stop:344 length:270 start_codon:yes stop_codon:yes gene_type:complete